MFSIKKMALGVSIFITLGGTVFISSATGVIAAEESQPWDELYPQASSTTPVHDDRVARIEIKKIPNDKTEQQTVLACTANHLGSGLWITAKHCLTSTEEKREIIQSDGDRATIKKVHFAEEGVDLAILETDNPAISSDFFTLPEENPNSSDVLTLIGFAAVHSYASEAQVSVTEGVQDNYVLWQKYKQSFKTVSVTDSRTCSGDSGGAVYSRNKIVGIHSAGPLNKECEGKQGSVMLHTAIFPSREWIERIIHHLDKDLEHSNGKNIAPFSSMSSTNLSLSM
ncbi:S1 family peptidase [Corynebacterium rouxii]|uniref:Peptidase S1 domain-containing protein n=1 Tax=Corynebacterium rouxii TaxID=2719119 RepID=A0A6I8MIK0_9CORY|nr:serine protease [Corynebacterium rouxii]VZH86003.1 hypothetical protein FRC0190_01936 [Corynebacterium rouxii]